MLSYKNINPLKEKVIPLRKILLNATIDVFHVDETTLGSVFPNHQFKIEGYQFFPFRRARYSKDGWKLVYLQEGFIVKRVLETEKVETSCIAITIFKKKCCILLAYKFFEEFSLTLSKALNKYDNLLSAGDLNINILRPTSDSFNHLSGLNDTFSLANLVTDSTCFK